MPEGQRQVVDLAHGAAGSHDCDAESTLIEVGAGVKEDPGLAQVILQYDVWLTSRTVNDGRQVRHFIAMGKQGASMDFAFVPLRSAVPRIVPNQLPYDLVTSVMGTLRGRLQSDGRIALTMDTERRDGLGTPDEEPMGSSGNSGQKRLEMAADEAIEIELPAPGGRSSRAAFAGGLAPGPHEPLAPTGAMSCRAAPGSCCYDPSRTRCSDAICVIRCVPAAGQ